MGSFSVMLHIEVWISVSWTQSLSFWFYFFFDSRKWPCYPDNFESYNALKLSFTNVWGLRSNFCSLWIFSWIKLSRYSCFIIDNLDFSNFSARGDLNLIWKDCLLIWMVMQFKLPICESLWDRMWWILDNIKVLLTYLISARSGQMVSNYIFNHQRA